MRKIFFWGHLVGGLVAGLAILLMCVTGVLLTYEKQVNRWLERRGVEYQAPAEGSARLTPEVILAKVREQKTGVNPSAIVFHADLSEPTELALGPAGALLVNPVTGAVVAETKPSPAQGFFRTSEDLHRWLAMTGPNRSLGKSIMDAGNLVFFVLVLSGIYLWIPKRMTWQHLRPVTWFRGGLSGKARDFSWHNVIGLWMWLPLVLVVGTGVIISYPWASNLLYSMTGSPPGLGGEGMAKGGGRPGVRKGGEVSGGEARDGERKGGEREGGRPNEGGGPAGRFNQGPADWTGLDAGYERAVKKVSGWNTIRVQGVAQANAPLSFTIDSGAGNQPQYQGRLAVNRATGEVVSWSDFSTANLGSKLRSLSRFTHTGESLGLIGQTIAGLATLGGCFLVYTGFALSLRRYAAWLKRRSRRGEASLVGAP